MTQSNSIQTVEARSALQAQCAALVIQALAEIEPSQLLRPRELRLVFDRDGPKLSLLTVPKAQVDARLR